MKQIQRLQRIIYNPTFGQHTELGAMCEQNALQQITQNNKKTTHQGAEETRGDH